MAQHFNSLRLDNILLPLSRLAAAADEAPALRAQAAARLRVEESRLHQVEILKKSLDARNKCAPHFVYSLRVELRGSLPAGSTPYTPPAPLAVPQRSLSGPRPCVVGAGPAGLFAAYLLARAGWQPLLIEQGQPVEQRRRDVDAFWQSGALDPLSNIQFGEGGAGAFSDGKLTSRSKDPLGREVLRLLIEGGADPSIAWWNKPHLGSDRLPAIIAALRRQIILLGGELRFATRLTDISSTNGCVQGLSLLGPQGAYTLECRQLILAVGNGAAPVYRLLDSAGAPLAAKPFAVGLRIQQPQALIDRDQYGRFAGHPLLAAADYGLTYQHREQQRGCYTFCNCPGGFVVNASSAPQGAVCNGVSLAARDGAWANAAVVAQVSPGRDFGSDPLAGLEFQQQLEQAAYALGGGGHALPLMSAAEFCGGAHADISACPSREAILSPGLSYGDLRSLFSAPVTEALQAALAHWNRQLPGFCQDAWLIGVESRTSTPLRILRGEDRQSPGLRGLYPAGEGAGYAGGIISSAIDGLRAALALLESAE